VVFSMAMFEALECGEISCRDVYVIDEPSEMFGMCASDPDLGPRASSPASPNAKTPPHGRSMCNTALASYRQCKTPKTRLLCSTNGRFDVPISWRNWCLSSSPR
jgi:hypothetical protein